MGSRAGLLSASPRAAPKEGPAFWHAGDLCALPLKRPLRHERTGTPPDDARFGVALVGEQLVPRQVLEQCFEIVVGPGVLPELPRELGAAVLTPREQPQGPLAQAGLAPHRPFYTSAVTGADASGFLTPSFSRIFASISPASSGFSFRKSRALSLPWPMRSFLYWYQAPDLSTTPQLTPSSRISPSSETPSP